MQLVGLARHRAALARPRLEAFGPQPPEDRALVADRIEALTDPRVGRFWTLGVING
ncbi:MAG: hypothetical protein ACRD0J_01810 [Acidimicrobiales bacterium]